MSNNSYANITKSENPKNNEEKKMKVKPGWSLITRNKNGELKVEDYEKYRLKKEKDKKEYEKRTEKRNYNKIFNRMIDNWENFRNTDIELRGDLSEYIDNDNEINKIVEEENYIAQKLYEYNNRVSDDSDSDEESNRHLIY